MSDKEKLENFLLYLANNDDIDGFAEMFGNLDLRALDFIDELPNKKLFEGVKKLKNKAKEEKNDLVIFSPIIKPFFNEKIGIKESAHNLNNALKARDGKLYKEAGNNLLLLSLRAINEKEIEKIPQLLNFFNYIIKENPEAFDIVEDEDTKEKIKREKATDEARRLQKEEDNKILNEKVATMKNKMLEEQEPIKSTIKEEISEKSSNIPRINDYINKKVFNESWKSSRDELFNTTKKEFPELSDEKIKEINERIYFKGAKEMVKNEQRFKKLLQIRGYNPSAYEQLPEDVKIKIEKWNTENLEAQQRLKNKKFILPKVMPKWKKAIEEYNINPMLGRGAFGH